MIKINLLPPEYAQAQARKEQQILLGGVAGILVLILGLYWGVQSHRSSNLAIQILDAQAKLDQYQAIVSQIERIEQDKARLTSKRDVIKNLNQSRLVYPVFFEDFLPIIPSDVWVSKIGLIDKNGRLEVSLNANAMSNFALATWLTNLQQSQHFNGVEISAISYSGMSDTGVQTLSFSITCSYKHVGPFPLQEFN